MGRRSTVVLAGAGLALALVPGCATPDINGAVGITVSSTGTPVAVAVVCHGSIDHITVAGPNRGTEPNELRADLTTPDALTRSVQVDLVTPGAGWTGTPLALPLADDLHIVIASDGDGNSQLTQTEFTDAELGTLTPGTVQYSRYDGTGSSTRVRALMTDFAGATCS